jgi:predicted ATPase/DNA-binding winged helix-turn-helix (wHTH) protein
MEPASGTSGIVEFGRFRIVPRRRELLAGGRPIQIGGRAFDVLMALIESRGAAVSKEVLISRVWPNRIVDDNNLQVQISVLRNAFGADRELIRTVPGRGYLFTGEIRTPFDSYREVIAGPGSAERASGRPPTNLPEPVSELIGRDEELQEILNLAVSHRLVTLTGAGGIGKTRLGLETARRLLPKFADGVWIAELAPLFDPDLVPATVAAAVGIELAAGEVSAERVATALGAKQLLLVLDNCEHVIDAAASMVEALLRANPAGSAIATSREPLRAEGEWIYRVAPLAVPAGDTQDVADALRFGAVRLFVTRAGAAEPHFAPNRRAAAVIVAICRRLDGIPLAIELAAARAAALGIDELATRLDDRFHLLTGGRRTALPRHQTLRATLDWSYQLLAEPERVILRRLAIFPGGFGLDAARAVAARGETEAPDVVAGLVNLVTKSLVSMDVDGAATRYRLLETTRAYALEKLSENGERERVARRHAEYHRGLFERAEAEWDTRPTIEWLADYRRYTDDLRAALDWAFSHGGDTSVGVALTAASVPLWMHLSLMEECRGRVERALAALGPGPSCDARREMQLQAALAASLMFTKGLVPEVGTASTRALEIAERLDAAEYQLRSLWRLWSYHSSIGQHRIALTFAQRFCALAAIRSDPTDRLVGDRFIGTSQHYLGDQRSARNHIEGVLSRYVAPAHRSHIIRFQRDQGLAARTFLARILWLQGFPEQAVRTAQIAVEEAQATHHALSLCPTLAEAACPIALEAGDFTAAEHYVRMLLDHSARHALVYWRARGCSFEAEIAARRGGAIAEVQAMCARIGELGEVRIPSHFLPFRGVLAQALGRAGQIADGLAAIDEALDWSESTEERLGIAELLRIKGVLLLLEDGSGAAAAAEDHFKKAGDWARQQGALSWELRAATSLARLQRDQKRTSEAMALLTSIYNRFTEGFDTADLKSAKALIDDLRSKAVVIPEQPHED